MFFYIVVSAQNEKVSFIESLNQKIPELVKDHQIPGMVIAVINDGDIIYKKGIGFADIKEEVLMHPATGFNIGSVSKMFTAWGVMKLIEDGLIDLDAPVENYLTRWKLPASQFESSKVTIKSLLGHIGGISVHGYPGFHPDTKLPTLEASLDGENGPVRANEKVEVIIDPQTKFQYSGGGYTILQLMIEEVSKMPFEKYMHTTIFKPLKMKNTSFTINRKILKNTAQPYDKEGKEFYLERFTAKAAAGLHTNLNDLIVFAEASLEKNSILKQETLETMLIPSRLSKGGYGLGYVIYPFGKMTVKGHTGTNTGWESAFLLDFEHNSGIIMLTNISEGDTAMRKILREWVQWKSKQLKSEK